jgi:hypothetical protein
MVDLETIHERRTMKHKHWRVAHVLFDATDSLASIYYTETGRYYYWDEDQGDWKFKNKRKPYNFHVPFAQLDIKVSENYAFDNLQNFLDFRDAVIRKQIDDRVKKLNVKPPGGVLLVSSIGPREVSFSTERVQSGSRYIKRYFGRYEIQLGLAFMKQSKQDVFELERKDIVLPPDWYDVPPRWCPELVAW